MSDISRLPMSDIGWWWFGLPAALRTVQQKLGAMALEQRTISSRRLVGEISLFWELCGRCLWEGNECLAGQLRFCVAQFDSGCRGCKLLPDYSACLEDQNFDEELAFKITRNKAAAVVRSHSDLLQAMLDIRAKAVALECVPPFGENGLTKEVYAVSVSTCRKHGGLKRNYTSGADNVKVETVSTRTGYVKRGWTRWCGAIGGVTICRSS